VTERYVVSRAGGGLGSGNSRMSDPAPGVVNTSPGGMVHGREDLQAWGGRIREEADQPLHAGQGSPHLFVQTAQLRQIAIRRGTIVVKRSRLGYIFANFGILSQGERKAPIVRINYSFILLFYSLPKRSAVQLN
jgi:hypothetical protein